MKVSQFDFDLPEDRIALRPAEPRDAARMMVVHPDGRIDHRLVRDLPDYLDARDVLVVNDTKVMAARLRGRRLRRGISANIEILLHRRVAADRFTVLARPARKLLVGDEVLFGRLAGRVTTRGEAGEAEVAFALSGAELDAAIEAEGEVPLPPYIAGKRKADARDIRDYQTMFARERRSVAAPTAGLHFTPVLMDRLARTGAAHETITLHVGLGTFLPVTAEDTEAHRMHSESLEITSDTAARINHAHAEAGRVLAVGTTSLRALESATKADGLVRPFAGETDIFIVPGYRFRVVDRLLTNFHLPCSTLFMLVSAFMGLEVMQAAYAEAIREGYRFYSYGDACLLLQK
jgi:S-adenosylmethionine:tRNA ribosyltransferase-isomerase